MAGRILNRRELRKQADHADQAEGAADVETAEDDAAEDDDEVAVAPKKATKRKAAAGPKVKKPRKVKAPPRMRARWGVFDGGMKQIAVFDYNQRAAADEKLADLVANKKGTFFMQLVKEAMPLPEEVPEPV
jgi:hypothetical protein